MFKILFTFLTSLNLQTYQENNTYIGFLLIINLISTFAPMKSIPFDKYQSTGNDFVIIDQRNNRFIEKSETEIINRLCDRRFGVGADGLILLEHTPQADFEMVYFNADGNESTLCGNGGRSIVKFAQSLGIIHDKCEFMAIDGLHHSIINEKGDVELQMNQVNEINRYKDYFTLNTGSPHYVSFCTDINSLDVEKEGADIRYSELFKAEGINVNFVQKDGSALLVRTYERGVEGETLSCGTGVTAAAIASSLKYNDISENGSVNIQTKGGELLVKFKKEGEKFTDIWLCGPAQKVFKGIAYV